VKQILGYLQLFIAEQVCIKKTAAYFTFIATACWLNYFSVLKGWQRDESAISCFLIYAAIFLAALLFGFTVELKLSTVKKLFPLASYSIILIAVLLFAVKIVFPSFYIFSSFLPNRFVEQWNLPLYWVGNIFFVVLSITIIYRLREKKQGLYGLTKTTPFWPYVLMLAIMTPVIWLAAQQTDFQLVYPKAKSLGSNAGIFQHVLFQLSYVADFFTIELFFRGFLIIVLSKYFNKNCILPIALFYFTIHLGKPLAEAVSSFLGGTLLGIISYHTKSIWGGWVVHAGIALLMELFGYLF
jgi:membrane protease YdiL (CAAX protease family)